MMKEKQAVRLLTKVFRLLGDALDVVEITREERENDDVEFSDSDPRWIVDVCLDCMEVRDFTSPFDKCLVEKHTLLSEVIDGGATDISGAYRCLGWILKQIRGDENG